MIKDAVKNAIDAARAMLSGGVNQELVKQYTNPAPKNKYACFFTAFYMYFRTVKKIKLSFMEYRDACLKIGAINDSFAIKDRSKMAAAAGFPELVCKDTAKNIREKILELLLCGKPVPFSLNGEHYESIDGYEWQGESLRFKVDDPGWQNDTFADGDTLEVYREENGKRKYSVPDSGKGRRKITRVYWFEEK